MTTVNNSIVKLWGVLCVYCLKITTVLHLAHGEKDFVIAGMRLEAVNFSIIFTVGKVPNEWKFAQVTFIPKSTKLSDNAYYCPVSLLSSVEQAVGTYPYFLWNIRT